MRKFAILGVAISGFFAVFSSIALSFIIGFPNGILLGVFAGFIFGILVILCSSIIVKKEKARWDNYKKYIQEEVLYESPAYVPKNSRTLLEVNLFLLKGSLNYVRFKGKHIVVEKSIPVAGIIKFKVQLKSYEGSSHVGVATNVSIVMSDDTHYHFAILDYKRFSQLLLGLNPSIIVLKSQQSKHTATPHLQPISWNEIIKECYDKNLEYIYPVSKVIYADDKTERAVILKESDTLYTIDFQKLYQYDDDELKYFSDGLHGYWGSTMNSGKSFLDTEKDAIKLILSEPPYKHNKSVIWSDCAFRIDAENLCWIKNDDADDPDDLCLHGHAFAKIGDELLEYDATVSATGLYLLRTLTNNHNIRDNQPMLPCCGHSMYANEDLSTVDIGGCPNGIDWSVIHENGKIRLVTEVGKETLVDVDNYKEEVLAFADKIEAFYEKCLPKNMPSEEYERNGYTAFWNEWCRRRS